MVAIRGSRRWVAGLKSESRPASDRNRWPASSESAPAAWEAQKGSVNLEEKARFFWIIESVNGLFEGEHTDDDHFA